MELKQIDFSTSHFEAKGVTYHVKPSLSVERYRWFEKLQLDFGFGHTFKELYDMLQKAVDLANKGKGLESWNIVFNIKESVGKNLDNRAHTSMYICSLFIVTEEEDLTKWDEQEADQKIKNWNDEGYDVNCFFRLAANLVNGYITALDEIFQPISELAAKMEPLNDLKPKD
jgi:hypothetical protein